MLKILYVIPRLAKAGTENHLLRLASGLSKEDFDITICCLFMIGEFDKRLANPGLKIICLERKNTYDLRIIVDLYRFIKKEKYDIVHAYLFSFQYLAAIPAKLAGVPIVISSRRELASWKTPHHYLLENLGNMFTDKVIACSEAAKAYSLSTENLTSDKIQTIYNGVNIHDFYPKVKNPQILSEFGFRQEDIIVGMVTKLEETKDIETAIEALACVKNIYPDFKCLIVGDGHLKNKLKQKAIKLDLEKNVRFAGRRDNIAALLSVMDVFILTSISEGLPNVILEAMACALPIVSTNVGGISEVLESGKSGILVEPKDSKAISAAIIKLIDNENLRIEMGRRGREIIEAKFSQERMLAKYQKLYFSLIK